MKKKSEDPLQPLIDEFAAQLNQGKPLTGADGVFTPLLKKIIEASLEGEMDAHLADKSPQAPNRRNGHTTKQLQSSLGRFEVATPRDRTGEFDPQIVSKRQRRITSDIDQKILALYGRGMSYRDIQAHLSEIYGIEVSAGTLSAITDRILPEIYEWQQRPLEAVYPVIWLDAMHFKVRREGQVTTRAVYSVLGVDTAGIKQVLGIYLGDHESSVFWRGILDELVARGVQDIFVACIDDLGGFGDVIEDVFPATVVQLCLVHKVRNALKYVPYKDRKAVARSLKAVYKAKDTEEGWTRLQQARREWSGKYSVIFDRWENKWERISPMFAFPAELRRVIYTTNPVESYHRMVRKVTKSKGAFTSEQAILKQVYMATINANTKWHGQIYNWAKVRGQLAEYFNERFLNHDTL